MSEPQSGNMICPKCGSFQKKADTCKSCGVIMAKVRKPAEEETADDAADETVVQLPPVLEPAPKLSLVARISIAAVLAGFAVFIYLAVVPVDMTLAEFSEAKKSDAHLRGFRVEGTVSLGRSIISTQLSDGREMGTFKISNGDEWSFITYDPESTSYKPAEGDRVRVSGSFHTMPLLGGSPNIRTVTISTADRITKIQ